ncbi:sugar phosphate nucleotidyltransferase [Aureitalea marina]|uniref:Nucleotidyl transferase domain-containing protein n=1 Tax=Aureitalea marina TaxID=930804 RepID=A0A2S7KN16_9FLAO|nr:sugar phosphate nucleotidyltransferase [Aureitalea marina]PQB03953.1 hypothetical protein BST85_02795 [Aureitalea marina]
MTDKLLILAAGASTRMKASKGSAGLTSKDIELANSRSKSLIPGPDGHRPVLDHLILRAKTAGISQIYLIVGANLNDFQEYYGPKINKNEFHGIQIHYAIQHIPTARSKPLGTADAVYQAMTQYPELQQQHFLVCNSDNLYSAEAINTVRLSNSPAALMAYDRAALEFSDERIARFALLQSDSQNFLSDIIEKPEQDKVDQFRGPDGKFRVSMNIFSFDGSLMFPYLRDCPFHQERGEKEIPTALLNATRDLEKACFCYPISEHVPDLTSKEDIEQFRKFLK